MEREQNYQHLTDQNRYLAQQVKVLEHLVGELQRQVDQYENHFINWERALSKFMEGKI